MKYNLTLEFESKSELLSFLESHEASGSSVPVTVGASGSPASKGKGKTKGKNVEDAIPGEPSPVNVQPVMDPFAHQAAQQHQAPVQQAPVQQVNAAPAVDRNGIETHINSILADLRSRGVTDVQITDTFKATYAELGIAPAKIGTLTDENLVKVYNTFVPKCNALAASLSASSAGSFI